MTTRPGLATRSPLWVGVVAVVCVALGPLAAVRGECVVPLATNCWCMAEGDATVEMGWNYAANSGSWEGGWGWAMARSTAYDDRLEYRIGTAGSGVPGVCWAWLGGVPEYMPSTLTIGTSASIPEGTPLTLLVHAERFGERSARYELYRDDEMIFDAPDFEDAWFEVPVFAGETLIPGASGAAPYVDCKFTVTIIPEPATLIGLAVVAVLVRRR